ncbi:MAG TPA: DNA polymerase III subunit delta [Candidatus Acidoferrales bacterium]|nr:DNA polymerase III subunit delta [Candidatus Acidoferrales bacterium]
MPGDSTSVAELVERLKKGKLIPALTLLGAETYLRDTCRKLLVETFTDPATRDWSVSQFSAEDDDADRVINQAQMRPMLASTQVVVWREVQALERLGEDSREKVVEMISNYLDDPAPFTILVIEADKLDQRTKLFKTFADKTLMVACELGEEGPTRDAQAAVIAVGMARETGLHLARDAAELLAESTNSNLARMRTELDKLAVYAGERNSIVKEDVAAMVMAEKRYTVWQLADMMANGEEKRAITFLNALLRDGEQPVAIVGTLAWMCRKLLETQELGRGADVWKVVRLGMRRDTAEIALRAAPKIPRQQLIQGLAALAEADSRLKGGAAVPNALMEFLVAKLAKRAERIAVA